MVMEFMEAPQSITEFDAEEAREEELNPEAQVVHTKKATELLIQAEVAAHDAAHWNYRRWCEVCVAGSGKEDIHLRSLGMDDEPGLPIVSLHYELLERKVTVFIANGRASGVFLAYTCTEKNPADQWIVKQFIRDLHECGRKDICVKTDGEPAMIALQRAVADARALRTVRQNLQAHDSQSNGSVEKAVQDVAATILLCEIASH